MREKLLFAVAGAFLMCLALPASAYAQEAFTIPRSDRIISGELTLPNNWKARFVVRDGTWVTVEYKGGYFAFIGSINDQTDNPNFIPYRLHRLTPEHTKAVELDQSGLASRGTADPARDIPIGETATFTSARGIKLEVTGTGVSVFAAPYITDISKYSVEDLEKRFGFSSAGMCCVTCQGVTVCAGSVDTSCGDCNGGGGGRVM